MNRSFPDQGIQANLFPQAWGLPLLGRDDVAALANVHPFGSLATLMSSRAHGFASPPHDGFALFEDVRGTIKEHGCRCGIYWFLSINHWQPRTARQRNLLYRFERVKW